MSATQPLEESILAEARAEMGLSESQREERFVALRAGISAGALPSMDGDLALHSLDFEGAAPSGVVGKDSSSSAMEWLWGVNPLKLLGAGLALGGTLGFFLGHESAPSALAPESASSAAKSPIPAEVQEARQPAIEVGRGTQLSEIPLDEEPLHAPNQASEKALRSGRSSPVLPDKAHEPTFHEELSYLRRAQAALRSGKPALALGLMQSLDEMQKVGALGLERRVTKTLALCALDRSAEAKAMATPVFQSQPDSVYARRLSESCAGSPDLADDFKKK